MRHFIACILVGAIVNTLTTAPTLIVASQNERLPQRTVAWWALQSSVVLTAMTKSSPPREQAFCGGTILSADIVLTAAHCTEKRPQFAVKTHGGTYPGATLLRASLARDLALVKLTAPVAIRFPPISTDIAVGDTVLVIGAPDGEAFVFTRGVIAKIAPDESFENCKPNDTTGTKKQQLFIHDAMTYFGNSGGGIFDDRGNLIGVNVRVNVPLSLDDCGLYLGEVLLHGYGVGPEAIRDFLGEHP